MRVPRRCTIRFLVLPGLCLLCTWALASPPRARGVSGFEELEDPPFCDDGTFDPSGAAVRAAIDALKSPDRRLRHRAAVALGWLGDAARSTGLASVRLAVPALIEAMRRDRDVEDRVEAMRALGIIGPEARAAVPALVAALAEADPGGRSWALWALRQLGPAAAAAVPALYELLHSAPDCAAELLCALVRVSPDPAEVLPIVVERLLRDDDPAVHRDMMHVLVVDLNRPTAARVLVARGLQHEDEPVRARAAAALACLHPEDPANTQALMDALKDPSLRVRVAAAEALGRTGLKDPAALLAVLRPALRHQDSKLRDRAAAALEEIGPVARMAAPDLVAVLGDPVADVRISAAAALESIGGDTEKTVAVLIGALGDETERVRVRAVQALRRIALSRSGRPPRTLNHDVVFPGEYTPTVQATWALGVAAVHLKSAVPALTAVAEGRDSRSPSPPTMTVVETLIRALEDKDENVRAAATEALGGMGSAARAAMPLLRPDLRGETTSVRARTACALWRIGRDEDALPTLVDLTHKKDWGGRRMALQYLAELGRDVAGLAPVFLRLTWDSVPAVRSAAAFALWRATGETEVALQVLLAAAEESWARPQVNPDRAWADERAQCYALLDLEAMGAAARPAIPVLERIQSGRRYLPSWRAGLALAKIRE